MEAKRQEPISYQFEHPMLEPSKEHIKKGDLKEGELITNIFSGACWMSDAFDVEAIDASKHSSHIKFRKMLPKQPESCQKS